MALCLIANIGAYRVRNLAAAVALLIVIAGDVPMRSLATTVLQFPNHLAAAPRCAQCQTKMTLERVEPHPDDSGKDRYTYVCSDCGLADRVDCART